MKETILLVDDEPDILEFLSYNLKRENYTTYTAKNGFEAIELCKKIKPDLILLDLMMPEVDGIEVCCTIREDKNTGNPIIAFLSSRSEDYSQVMGLQSGADDYITKPIRPRLLISKIEALLRRNNDNKTLQKSNGLHIDRNRFLVLLDNKEIMLPKKEFELLELLISKPGHVFDRDAILSKVWGNSAIVGERTIDVHIRKLRKKIGENHIRTVTGVGYTYEV